MKKNAHRFLKLLYINRDIPWLYLSTLYEGIKYRKILDNVETYCMFIGYPRSGHSLVGSLLDAHPNIVIAHELDALRFLHAGFRRNQIYSLILDKDREFSKAGREWTGYQYTVPNQWQGRFEKLRIIGDKKGGESTARLHQHPELLDLLRQTVGVRVQFIHVVRNPYDNISTIARRNGLTLTQSIEAYFSLCDTVADIKRQVDKNDIIDLRHESVIKDPKTCLTQMGHFLRISCSDAYLNDCAGIVFESPHKTRSVVTWTKELIQAVESKMALFPWLDGYALDN